MKKINIIVFLTAGLVILFLLVDRCNIKADNRRVISQLSEYQLKEKSFTVKRLHDSSTIVEQNQTILTQKEAIKLGLASLDNKMKQLQAQIRERSEVVIVDKLVPFIPSGWIDTTGLVRNEAGEVIRTDSLSVPKEFKLNERWFRINGYVNKVGVNIDSLVIPNKTVMSIGYKGGFLKKREAIVSITNENPYVNVIGLDNVVIKERRNILRNPLIMIPVGVVIGYLINKN